MSIAFIKILQPIVLKRCVKLKKFYLYTCHVLNLSYTLNYK